MAHVAQSIGVGNTWTPTYTGFSADPASTLARYILDGKRCTLFVNTGTGTSNATAFTMTMPFTAKSASFAANGRAVDAGAAKTTNLFMTTTASSNVLTLYTSPAAGAWTNTGLKAASFEFTYEIE